MKKVLILLFAVVVLLPATGIAKKRDSDLMGTYSVRGAKANGHYSIMSHLPHDDAKAITSRHLKALLCTT